MAGRVLADGTATAAPAIDWPAAFKEAALAGFVALVLFLPLVGMELISIEGGLGIRYRFEAVALGVALVVGGRLLLIASRTVRPGALSGVTAPFRRIPALLGPYAFWFALAGILFAFLLPFLPFANRYVVDVATTVLIYVMLGWGLNIVVGLAGLLDLGYVAFYAVGAYSYALLAINFDLSFWECLPLAGLFAGFFGVLLGFPVLRLRGDYLAIVTLGFGEMIRIILLNWYDVTRGPDGLSGVPRPSFFGMEFTRRAGEGEVAFHEFFGLDYDGFHRVAFLYFLILILALITNAFVLRIRKLPIGRAWEALREDEIACRALGINPTNTKLTAFALGATFGGFAGSFFATRQGFISPESFTFIESALILAIVVLGGMGSQVGVVLAALVLILLPEFGREFEQFRMLLFGAAMVAIMVWRPRGLLAHREPTIRLHGDPSVHAGKTATPERGALE
jgi:branched-chain amino acid transport system permease protein